MLSREFEQGRCLLARLDHGADIVRQISDLAENKKIETGVLSVIGALEQAELVSCFGNISVRDGQPFVHAHAALADSEGKVLGGHLTKGTVFAAELCLQELLGQRLIREHDSTTGLYLWGEK